MANFKSQVITNQEAIPALPNDPPGGMTTVRQFFVFISTGDNANGDTTELVRVSPRLRIYAIDQMCVAHTGATDVSIGVRYAAVRKGENLPATQISAAADECLSDSQTWTSAQNVYRQLLGVGGTLQPTNVGKMLWELAGLPADPMVDFSIIVLWNIGTTAAGPFQNVFRFTVSGEN